MGGSQSTRKIGLDNEEAVGVIRVSENVAHRLQNVNNGNKDNTRSTFTNPHPETNVNHANVNFQEPTPGFFVPQPYVTSSMVRQEIAKELEKNDRYWERRIKGLQDNQNRITHVLEAEFDKAYKEVESNFPTLAAKSAALPCQDYKSMVIDCFKNNANQTLNCRQVVNEFTSCISNSRSKRHSENRSP